MEPTGSDVDTRREARDSAVRDAMADIRQIEHSQGVTAESVAAIRDRLISLTQDRELFDLSDFPAPEPGDGPTSFMYRLAQDPDDRFVLYAQASQGEVETPPHNHTTWAVVVGFDGQELNRFYARSEESGVEPTGEFMVEAGAGVAMLPDDLHSIHINGSALNFHCYGLALERLDERQYWNEEFQEWRVFSNVSGIREARPGLLAC